MKRFRNTIILSVLLALTLCVGAQAAENTMLKVGLKYGTNALFTARLQNYNDTLSGSGYEFGYYDADRSFVPLAATDEQRITVTVDSNAYVSGGVCYRYYFIPGDSFSLCVTAQCPEEAIEGNGARMAEMVASIAFVA